MSDHPAKVVSGSCLGGVLGAVLGIVIGGFIGPLMLGFDPKVDQGEGVSGIFNICTGIFGALLGVSIGGIIGAIGGSALGAAFALKPRRAVAESPADTPESSLADSAAELPRLGESMAEFKERRSREEGLPD
jgi:prolipoprotein diacylglyceryltransferase